jgi:hypothetical protein
MGDIERWRGHSPMSDPAHHADAIARLPTDVGVLNRTVQGLLIHSDWLAGHPVDLSRMTPISRQTLPLAERLDHILSKDGSALAAPRPPQDRSVGTCRDFALMLTAFLRAGGMPARVRCGFAGYFSADWEDHWICEYWDRATQVWRISDAQIDELLRDRLTIEFDPSDVPRAMFMTAGQAWRACRREGCDPARFGHGQTRGLWFVMVNAVRDHYALNRRETSQWDEWRAAPGECQNVTDRQAARIDEIADLPEQPMVEFPTPWTSSPTGQIDAGKSA